MLLSSKNTQRSEFFPLRHLKLYRECTICCMEIKRKQVKSFYIMTANNVTGHIAVKP